MVLPPNAVGVVCECANFTVKNAQSEQPRFHLFFGIIKDAFGGAVSLVGNAWHGTMRLTNVGTEAHMEALGRNTLSLAIQTNVRDIAREQSVIASEGDKTFAEVGLQQGARLGAGALPNSANTAWGRAAAIYERTSNSSGWGSAAHELMGKWQGGMASEESMSPSQRLAYTQQLLYRQQQFNSFMMNAYAQTTRP